MDFLKRSNRKDIRLLGGEPFLHSNIGDLIQNVLDDGWFEHLTIFTSGFIPSAIHPMLSNKKINLVVNLNHPHDYRPGKFSLLKSILEGLADQGVRMLIGHNIYRDDFDYAPIVKLARELGSPTLRWTIAVPSVDHEAVHLNRKQRRNIAPRLLAFLQACTENYLRPVMDCPIEPCLFTDEQLGRFARLCPEAIASMGKCSTPIDIGPGYIAQRCFATGSMLACDVRKFATLEEIVAYYQNTFERYRMHTTTDECKKCSHLRLGRCFGGCIAENPGFISQLKVLQGEIPRILSECKNLYAQQEYGKALKLLKDHIDDIFIQELVVEYANALIHAGDESAFLTFIEEKRDQLIISNMPAGHFLLANYLRKKGDFSGTLGFLRRSLPGAKEDKIDKIKYIIRQFRGASNGQ
jgi:radical SAM protein with 4Fe4S-binding SPASM domain